VVRRTLSDTEVARYRMIFLCKSTEDKVEFILVKLDRYRLYFTVIGQFPRRTNSRISVDSQ